MVLIPTVSGTGPLSYSWTVNGNQISTAQSPTYVPGGGFLAGLTVTNAYGQYSTSQFINVSI